MRKVGAPTPSVEIWALFDKQKRESTIKELLTKEKVVLRMDRGSRIKYISCYISEIEIGKNEIVLWLERPHSSKMMVIHKFREEGVVKVYCRIEEETFDFVEVL